MTLVEARSVSRRFGPLTAVDRVDLTVDPGEVVGLLGANGAGKTTLIRMLLGLLAPGGGTVRLFGLPPSRATRRRLGYLPQSLGLYEDMTVAENLTFLAGAFGVAPPARLDGDLEAVRGRLVGDLPLGLRRRVAFAGALAHHPELLVLDEPTSGVDPLGRARLWEEIRASAEAGSGVLVTTHYLREAEQCDRLVMLADGRVVASGGMAAILSDAPTVEVRADRWEAAFTALERAGIAAALVGRTLRVAGGDPARVAGALRAAGVHAALRTVPADFDETFVALARGRAA